MKFKDFLKIVAGDIINPMLLKAKREKKYHIPNRFNGINIGCGINNPNYWIGVDGGFSHYVIHKLPKQLYKVFFKTQRMSANYSFNEYYKLSKNIKLIHHELTYGLPFDNESVPNIYTSHFLEHLFYKDGEFIINECFRVLKPNGIIRICVPSLSEHVESIEEAIINFKKYDSDEIQKYVTSNIIGYNSSYSNHRYMYDWNRLLKLLHKVGFRNIVKCDYQKGKIPNVEDLDTREGLIVEAMK